jgi:AraC-like DNA-binding protein
MIISHAMHVRLCAARALLASPQEPDLSIAELAARVHLSPFHLTRRFAAVFGTTPHQYRTAARLTRARELLARGEHTVTEVCFALGFSSLGSFSALFRAHVGESPLAYQRRVRRLWVVPGEPSHALTPGCLSLMCFLPPEAAAQFSRSAAASRPLASAE